MAESSSTVTGEGTTTNTVILTDFHKFSVDLNEYGQPKPVEFEYSLPATVKELKRSLKQEKKETKDDFKGKEKQKLQYLVGDHHDMNEIYRDARFGYASQYGGTQNLSQEAQTENFKRSSLRSVIENPGVRKYIRQIPLNDMAGFRICFPKVEPTLVPPPPKWISSIKITGIHAMNEKMNVTGADEISLNIGNEGQGEMGPPPPSKKKKKHPTTHTSTRPGPGRPPGPAKNPRKPSKPRKEDTAEIPMLKSTKNWVGYY